MLIPGFFIFLTVISFNFLGDGIRKVADPRNW
jgi:ABC-type dipeptide/oligopeptide/nickel transport system permease subunit